MSRSSVSFGIGLLFGVVAGVVGGVLYSPRPGEEMRQELKDVIDGICKEDKVTTCKSVSLDMLQRMKYTIEKQIAKVNDAVKAGRMAAAKHREELESGYTYN